MFKYADPPNKKDILEEIKNSPSLGDVKVIVDKHLPGWFITTMESYCSDYPHLQDNWLKLCLVMECEPAQIMIVEEIVFDENHNLTKILCELFTRCGFCVKRRQEYFPCEKCAKAIPTEALYNKYKKDGVKVPDKWSIHCSGCK